MKLKAVVLAAVLGAVPVLAAGDAPPDGWVTSKAKVSLMTAANVKSANVHVDTIDGVVTLYGKVKDQAQKDKAEQVVRGIDGVRGVRNLLQLVPEAEEKSVARADADIKMQAEKMLKQDVALNDSSIVVKSVDKGVVLLAGKARTFSDQLRAIAAVDQIAGVRRVSTEIEGPEQYGMDERQGLPREKDAKAGPRSSFSDTRITTAVKLKLLASPDVPGTSVNVDTNDGVVTLFGTVPTETSKTVAANEANRVSGVLRVENQLQIVPEKDKKISAAKDEAIYRDVKTLFKDRPDLKDVKFEVKGGAVRLTGQVPSAWTKLEVMRMARTVKGVKKVEEELTLKPAEPETDTKPGLNY